MTQTLADLLRRAQVRHNGASGRRLGEIAERNALPIDRTTINRILKGNYRSKPGRGTLEAIAQLAGVDIEDVYEAAGLPLPGPPFAEQLPPDVDSLTLKQREALIAVIRAMLNPDSETAPDDAAEIPPHEYARGLKQARKAGAAAILAERRRAERGERRQP